MEGSSPPPPSHPPPPDKNDWMGCGARAFCPTVLVDKAWPSGLACFSCLKGANYNVVLMNILCMLFGLAESIWTGTAMSAFLYTLSQDSNTRVGYVEAAQGISTLLFALPVGYMADKYSASVVIACGAILSFIACGTTAFATYEGAQDQDNWRLHYYLLLGAFCLWGIVNGMINGPAQALYAASTPQGSRSKYYEILFVGWGLSSTIGPVISIILFAYYGNQWTLTRLRNVILAGLSLELLTAVCMLFFRDDCKLNEEETSAENTAEANTDSKQDGERENGNYTLLGGNDEEIGDSNTNAALDLDKPKMVRTVTEQFLNEVSYCGGLLTRRSVPYILFCSDIIIAIGSGMTVKYFPLFFKNNVNMTPIEVQAIYAVTPIAMVMFSVVGTSLKDYLGRVQTIMLARVIGVGLLLTLALLAEAGVHSKYVLVPIYVIRTGIVNCTYPLDESILMDFCPKDKRAQWKSLESVVSFGWCGSAVLGGVLGDKHGYSFTFTITAVIQGSSLALTSLLLPLVPIKESARNEAKDVKQLDEEGDLQEPLVNPVVDSDRLQNTIQ